MRFALIFLCLAGFAYGSTKFDLTFINRALTKLLDEELQALANCAKDNIKCDGSSTYPDCLDSENEFISVVNLKDYFLLKVMKLELEGNMILRETVFKGLSEFEIINLESVVTVVPLGIEFKFTLKWDSPIVFYSNYESDNIIYTKYGSHVGIEGDGPLSVKIDELSIDVTAHKLLGGDMDYLKIKPSSTDFKVDIKSMMMGQINLADIAKTKFDNNFINEELDFEALENYVIEFFNNKLYPNLLPRKLRTESPILNKLGQCIFDNFPQ